MMIMMVVVGEDDDGDDPAAANDDDSFGRLGYSMILAQLFRANYKFRIGRQLHVH